MTNAEHLTELLDNRRDHGQIVEALNVARTAGAAHYTADGLVHLNAQCTAIDTQRRFTTVGMGVVTSDTTRGARTWCTSCAPVTELRDGVPARDQAVVNNLLAMLSLIPGVLPERGAVSRYALWVQTVAFKGFGAQAYRIVRPPMEGAGVGVDKLIDGRFVPIHDANDVAHVLRGILADPEFSQQLYTVTQGA